MFPTSAGTDARDVRFVNVERFGQFTKRCAVRAATAYFQNVGGFKFGLAVFFAPLVAAVCVVVFSVLFRGSPKNVLEPIVGLDPVLVSALETIGARPNECLEDKPVDSEHLDRPLEGREIDAEIASSSGTEFKFLPAFLADATPPTGSPLAPHAAIIANTVARESGDVSIGNGRIGRSHDVTSCMRGALWSGLAGVRALVQPAFILADEPPPVFVVVNKIPPSITVINKLPKEKPQTTPGLAARPGEPVRVTPAVVIQRPFSDSTAVIVAPASAGTAQPTSGVEQWSLPSPAPADGSIRTLAPYVVQSGGIRCTTYG